MLGNVVVGQELDGFQKLSPILGAKAPPALQAVHPDKSAAAAQVARLAGRGSGLASSASYKLSTTTHLTGQPPGNNPPSSATMKRPTPRPRPRFISKN